MAGNPRSKLAQLKAAMRAGDWQLALRIAARFEDLGVHKVAIVRAHEAHVHPHFYMQLGYDVEKLKAEGCRALRERYG
jgi:hypothetical protein